MANPLLIKGAFALGERLLDKFFPDPQAKAAAALELEKMRQTGELAELAASTDLAKLQIAVNVEDAKSTDNFQRRWRPFVGWVCGVAFGYAAILDPLLRFIAAVGFGYTGAFPAIDTNLTMQVLFGLLGLAGLRTMEKREGKA